MVDLPECSIAGREVRGCVIVIVVVDVFVPDDHISGREKYDCEYVLE